MRFIGDSLYYDKVKMKPNLLALILSSHFLQQVMVLSPGQTEQWEANRPLKYVVPVHHCC